MLILILFVFFFWVYSFLAFFCLRLGIKGDSWDGRQGCRLAELLDTEGWKRESGKD